MRRRDFIMLIGSAAWPLTAGAQPTEMPVIGLLSGNLFDERELTAFRKGLADAGYEQGRNVSFKFASAEGFYDRLPTLAAELANYPVAVIGAIGGTASAVAAKNATASIPIVFANGGDPIGSGLVQSLHRPAGNVTGISFFVTTLGAKRLEFLKAAVPRVSSIGFLVNPGNPNAESEMRDVEAAARLLNLRIQIRKATSGPSLEEAFSGFVAQGVDAMVVAADALFLSHRAELASLGIRYKLPTVCDVREHALAGALISYGTDRIDAYRQCGVYVGKVLKGTLPANLPVMQSTKFELVINLKTAKALGLEVPGTLVTLADELIN